MLPIIILAIEDEDDREFMASIYTDYKLLLFSEIRKIVNDQWAAEDLIQDTLLRLIDKVGLLRTLERPKLTSYVVTTGKNLAKNHLRFLSRHQQVSMDALDSDEHPSGYNMEDEAITHIMVAQLYSSWGDLPENVQELLERKYILMQSDEEIAKAFGIKEASVRMRLSRARRTAYGILSSKMKVASEQDAQQRGSL